MPSPAAPPRSLTVSYTRLAVHAGSHAGRRADHLEDCDGLRLPLHDDVAQRPELVLAFQPLARGVANDNPSAELLVERLEPRAQIHGVTNHGVAHDRLAPDIAGDHRTRVDPDADVQPRKSPFGLPPRVQTPELRDHRQGGLHR